MYEYEEIFPGELEKWRNNGAQLIDVREQWEYEDAHIPGAKNVPLGDSSKGRMSWKSLWCSCAPAATVRDRPLTTSPNAASSETSPT